MWHLCNRVVSQDEVFPLRAPFAVYEPCITPFLTHNCDPDQDGKITLAEWGECLDISPGEQSPLADMWSLVESPSLTLPLTHR